MFVVLEPGENFRPATRGNLLVEMLWVGRNGIESNFNLLRLAAVVIEQLNFS